MQCIRDALCSAPASMCFEVMQHLPLAGLPSEDTGEERSPAGVARSP